MSEFNILRAVLFLVRIVAILDVLFRLLGISLSGGSNIWNIGYGPVLAFLLLAFGRVKERARGGIRYFFPLVAIMGVIFIASELLFYGGDSADIFYRTIEATLLLFFGFAHLVPARFSKRSNTPEKVNA